MPLKKDLITWHPLYGMMNYQRERLLDEHTHNEHYELDFQVDLIAQDYLHRQMHIIKAVAGKEEQTARDMLGACKGYMRMDEDLKDWRLKFYVARKVDEV